MFIQVLRGRVKDQDAFARASDRWDRELKPGASGYLGATQGVADDGTAVIVARFESEEAARRNSSRPEQGSWWQEASNAFDGDVTFYDCPTVDVFGKGGSDDAGFVQLMIYKTSDVDELRKLAKEFEKLMAFRPDIIGGTTAIATDGTVVDTNYFTSEAAAREGESQPMTPQVQALMDRLGALTSDVEFVDLRNPRMDSA